MLGLAAYAVRSPVHGAMVASCLLLLSLMLILLPPMVILSSAVVVLVWLRKGWQIGLGVSGAACAVAMLISAASGVGPLAPLVLVLSTWVPALLMAAVLRSTVTLSLAMLSGAALAVVIVLGVHLFIDDPAAEWRRYLAEWYKAFFQVMSQAESGTQTAGALDSKKFDELLATVSEYMTGVYAAVLFLFAALSLLWARSWQAKLFNPGGLRTEFHALRLGKSASVVGLVAISAVVALSLPVAKSVAIVMIAVFAFQGMAIVHALVARAGLSVAWLVLIYLLMLLKTETILLIGVLGILDAWVDFRNRFFRTGSKSEPDSDDENNQG